MEKFTEKIKACKAVKLIKSNGQVKETLNKNISEKGNWVLIGESLE